MSRFTQAVVALIAVSSLLAPTRALGQRNEPADDEARLERLYEAVSNRFGQQAVECRLGTLKGGGRFAQVVIADSAAFHSAPSTQREAAQGGSGLRQGSAQG